MKENFHQIKKIPRPFIFSQRDDVHHNGLIVIIRVTQRKKKPPKNLDEEMVYEDIG